MITITTAVTITMCCTMFAFYFGQNLGRREKIEVIIDSMLTRLEKDGFIRTKKGKDGETVYERLKGRQFNIHIVEFGKCVW